MSTSATRTRAQVIARSCYTFVLLLLAACGESPKPAAAPARRATIGIQVSPAMTLVMVAKDKGFFQKHGIEVELKEFTAGKFALQAFLAGGVDFAVSGEVPVGLATLQGNAMRVVTQVVERTTNEVRLVMAADSGAASDPAKFFRAKKRKLATSFGGGPEFFTYTVLKRFGIRSDQVEIISQKPEDMPAALAAGSVDAIAIFEPFAYFAQQRSTRPVFAFSDSTLYSELYVLSVRPEQLQQRSADIASILQALLEAGDFIETNVAEAQAVTRSYTKLDSATVAAIWPSFKFKAALTADLVRLWTEQANWAKETAKVPSDVPIPDFRTIVEPRFLSSARAAAVTLK